MADTTVPEYLATMYRPDRDYLEGELVERCVGEWDHSRLQALLIGQLQSRAFSCSGFMRRAAKPGRASAAATAVDLDRDSFAGRQHEFDARTH